MYVFSVLQNNSYSSYVKKARRPFTFNLVMLRNANYLLLLFSKSSFFPHTYYSWSNNFVLKALDFIFLM